MNIRLLHRSDAKAYRDIRLEALSTTPLAYGTDADEFAMIPLLHIASDLGERDSGRNVFGLFDEGELVGIATLQVESGIKEQHKAHISGLFIKDSHRNQGFGRELVTRLLGHATQVAELELILLSVTTSQTTALRMYERLGFKAYGTEPKALKYHGQYVDEVYLFLQLTPG